MSNIRIWRNDYLQENRFKFLTYHFASFHGFNLFFLLFICLQMLYIAHKRKGLLISVILWNLEKFAWVKPPLSSASFIRPSGISFVEWNFIPKSWTYFRFHSGEWNLVCRVKHNLNFYSDKWNIIYHVELSSKEVRPILKFHLGEWSLLCQVDPTLKVHSGEWNFLSQNEPNLKSHPSKWNFLYWVELGCKEWNLLWNST